MTDTLTDLMKFIQIGARLDLKAVALAHILGVTGTDAGVLTLLDSPELLTSLIALLDDNSVPLAKDAVLCLVNISALEKGAEALLTLSPKALPLQKQPDEIVRTTLRFIFDKSSKLADQCCMILSNLSRPTRFTELVIDKIEQSGKGFDDIINIFTKKQYNEAGASLHYLGPVLSNLSQNSKVRKYILQKDKYVVQRLLPFTEYKDSVIRRGGVVGTLRNCCFEADFNEWLLSEEVDILPRLLLPLAGGEEFDDEDNEKLPCDLQFLPEDKTRESDPDIRCMLLEALSQLCSERKNREYIRDKNTYVILRELHKWEKDRQALLACENLVDLLIRTEEEIGAENLKNLEVPEDLHEDFKKADQQFLQDV